MAQNEAWERYLAYMPESKLELIDGRLVAGNSLAGSRYLLWDILDGWGADAALPMASPELWWQALRQGFAALDPPAAEKQVSTWQAWAAQASYEPELAPAGPPFDHAHYEARQRMMMELFRVAEASRLGRCLGSDCVVRLGADAMTPDVFLVGRDNLNRSHEYYLDGPPDLLIEILLPGHEAQDREVKRRRYEAGRVPEYWVIDPGRRTVELLRLVGNGYQPQAPASDGAYRPVSVPGLTFFPGRLWDETDHPNRYPQLFLAENTLPALDKRLEKGGPGWGDLPFLARPDLEPKPLRFEEFISWCGRAKFERIDDRPLIGGTLGTRNALGMLLRTLGLVEAVRLRHPRWWVEALREADESRQADAVRKAEWWALARRAARLLRDEYGFGRLAVIGDLVRPAPLNRWSDITLVAWDVPDGIPHEVHRALYEFHRDIGIELVCPETATRAERQEIEEEAVEL